MTYNVFSGTLNSAQSINLVKLGLRDSKLIKLNCIQYNFS